MDSEYKALSKVSGVQSLSSSVQSTPEKNGHSDEASRSTEPQDFLESGPKKEHIVTCFDQEKKLSASKRKMAETVAKTGKKTLKNPESKKATISPKCPARKQSRKQEKPVQYQSPYVPCSDNGCPNTWICKNSACRAVLSIDEVFCKRCSCFICHKFDDNKDPSLWLECSSLVQGESCGSSCHIECAFRRKKVGVVNLGQIMQLDGSYCCASCGNVSGILECWKKQLTLAKEARRVDSLCFRIYLSYRLLDGTFRYKELHEIIKKAKLKLESEVGPLSEESATMARGIVSRLSVAGDVQSLCSLAIEKADEWSAATSRLIQTSKEGSLPAACRVLFEEVTSFTVTIVLPTSSSSDIQGFKLWYCKTKEGMYGKEPVSVIPKSARRVLISNLQPCTEYSFRLVSYNETGELGLIESKCSTRSVDGLQSFSDVENPLVAGCSGTKNVTIVESDSEFKAQDMGKVLAWAQKQGSLHGFDGAGPSNYSEDGPVTRPEAVLVRSPRISRGLDLNIASVPDLNEDVPPVDFSRDEQTEHALVLTDDVNGVARSQGSGESENGVQFVASGEVPAVASSTERGRKRHTRTNEEAQDSDSILVNGPPSGIRNGTGPLDEKFEYCVKTIRRLECEGHIKSEFRLRLLTWFGLRSTEQERRVVNTFIRTLIDDPSSLAGQLVDAFSEIISNKKPKGGFCSKLWH